MRRLMPTTVLMNFSIDDFARVSNSIYDRQRLRETPRAVTGALNIPGLLRGCYPGHDGVSTRLLRQLWILAQHQKHYHN